MLLSTSRAEPGQTGLMGSIRFGFKLEVESVRFDFRKFKSRLGSTWRRQADGADGVDYHLI